MRKKPIKAADLYPVGTQIILTKGTWNGVTGVVVGSHPETALLTIDWMNGGKVQTTIYPQNELSSHHRAVPPSRTTEGPAQEYAILVAAQDWLS